VSEADVRRQARQNWQVRKFRLGETEEMADYDAALGDQIPPDERAAAVWQLSVEIFALAEPGSNEPGLPRSALRLQRR
jgi:hypothetical protein